MTDRYKRIQLKQIDAAAARFLSGPYVRLGQGDVKSSTITILRTGSFNHSQYGRFDITRELLEGMVENFNHRTYGQDIQMDVSHEPERGNAGDIKKLWVEGNRLRAVVEWTKYGLAAIRDRGFKYISADFTESWIDNEFEKEHGPVLFGAALVTRPHIKGMDAVQLSESAAGTVITFIHPQTIEQFQHEERNMKTLLDALRKKLAEMKLSSDQVTQFTQLFESTAEQLKDNEPALKQLSAGIEAQARQLAEALADGTRDKSAPIQLGEIKITTGASDDDLNALVDKRLAAAEADKAKKLEESAQRLADNQKIFNDAIAAAEGLGEDTVKVLNESRELITGDMTADQVTRLAEQQISVGNKLEASKKLAQMGYQVPAPAGSVHIDIDDSNGIKKLTEAVHKGLQGARYAAPDLKLLDEDKLHPFAKKTLAAFDSLYARELHEESKRLANGEVNIGSTALPVGVQRQVIREALSDLNVLALVMSDTDPAAQATTSIPYEVRDVAQVINDGLVPEGAEIPPAGVEQKMDTAFLRQMKISLNISNEVMHMSRSSVINWDAFARTVESNSRLGRELIARRLCNEIQRASDMYLSVDVAAEAYDSQAGKASGIIKLTNFPLVRPNQPKDLQGNNTGAAEATITVISNGTTLAHFDGSGAQAAGTYYKVASYNLGYIQLCDETGAAVAIPADTGVNTVGYTYATNFVAFDLDVPSGTLEAHLNGLLRAVGNRKAALNDDRFVTPDYLLMSNTLNDTCTNAEQFTQQGSKSGSRLDGMGDLATIKGVPAFGTNAPAVDLGDERILVGRQGMTTYKIAKPWMYAGPQEAVGPNGRPIGKKIDYAEEYSAIHTPLPIRGYATSVIAYSATARAAV